MIKLIKLITGEELIGDVTEHTDHITIKKPCILQMVPSRSDPEKPMMGLFPYATYTEHHEVNIKYPATVYIESPVKELYNQYNSAFGSGIVVAGSL